MAWPGLAADLHLRGGKQPGLRGLVGVYGLAQLLPTGNPTTGRQHDRCRGRRDNLTGPAPGPASSRLTAAGMRWCWFELTRSARDSPARPRVSWRLDGRVGPQLRNLDDGGEHVGAEPVGRRRRSLGR